MKLWTAFKAALFAGATITMLWHWEVVEAEAHCYEKSNGIPWAIVPSEAPATPSGATEILQAECVPYGHWESAGRHRITHYCREACCNGSNAGRTASGAPMVTGRTIAASKSEFPFGTRILINGQEYVVEDRGVGHGQIDVLVDSHSEARRKGLYYTDIQVWRED